MKALFDLEAAEVILKRVLKREAANTTAMDMLAEAYSIVYFFNLSDNVLNLSKFSIWSLILRVGSITAISTARATRKGQAIARKKHCATAWL